MEFRAGVGVNPLSFVRKHMARVQFNSDLPHVRSFFRFSDGALLSLTGHGVF